MDGLLEYVFYLVLVLIASYVVDTTYSYNRRKQASTQLLTCAQYCLSACLNCLVAISIIHRLVWLFSRLTSDSETIGWWRAFIQSVVGLVKDSINTIALLIMMLFIGLAVDWLSWLSRPWCTWRSMCVIVSAMYKVTSLNTGARHCFSTRSAIWHENRSDVSRWGASRATHTKATRMSFAAQKKITGHDAILFCLSRHHFNHHRDYDLKGSEQVIEGALTLGVLIAFINTPKRCLFPFATLLLRLPLFKVHLRPFDHIEVVFCRADRRGRA